MVRGKQALRAYWTAALPLVPDLHFTVERVYAGVSVLVISYRNQAGGLVDEVLVFADGLRGRGPRDVPGPRRGVGERYRG